MSWNKLGLLLLALYWLQYASPVEVDYLENLQKNSTYRQWSGLALFVLILHQWLLALFRAVFGVVGENLEKLTSVHIRLGAVSPLFFFLHKTKPGYGFLLVLSVLFFVNLLWGYVFNNNLKDWHLGYFRPGIAIHIVFSAVVLILTFLHIWLVFYYN